MTYPPRPSTFLEGDFNMVMDDQCQFHRDAKHTMRECEQLKRALGVLSTSKKTKSNNNDDWDGDQPYENRSRRIDVITVIAGPTVAMTTGIDVTIAATTTAMTDVTTIVAMTAMTDAKITRMIAVTTSTTITGMTDVMTDIAKTTATATTTTAKNGLHHHRLKGQPQRRILDGQPKD
jgi:hypothetical protein